MSQMDDLEKWKNQAEEWLNQGLEYAQQIPPTQLYFAISILFATTLLLISLRLFRRTKYNTIVLAGLSGGGKTVLFYQLRDGSSHQGTVTSMEPNEDTFVLHSENVKKGKIKPIHLVDVPGHSRLRPKLDEFLPQAAGIVFVVDALEFLPNCRATSEYLYDILTKASVVKKKIPVLICCSKTDKVTAHTKEFIRKQLEKEIDKLRVSRSAVSDADVTNDFTLGVAGEAFSFSPLLEQSYCCRSFWVDWRDISSGGVYQRLRQALGKSPTPESIGDSGTLDFWPCGFEKILEKKINKILVDI